MFFVQDSVCVCACVEDREQKEAETREWCVLRAKESARLDADYVFTQVRRVGTICAIVLDLERWDCEEDLLEVVDELQREEEDFLSRLFFSYSKARCTLAVVKVNGANSRSRFYKLQRRYSVHFVAVLIGILEQSGTSRLGRCVVVTKDGRGERSVDLFF